MSTFNSSSLSRDLLRLAQILRHLRYAFVRRPEVGLVPSHIHLPCGYGIFYATGGVGLSGRACAAFQPIRGILKMQLKKWVLW
jgi:hypothetical protein